VLFRSSRRRASEKEAMNSGEVLPAFLMLFLFVADSLVFHE